MKEIIDLARKSDWQVAAREVCRGRRSLSPLAQALVDVARERPSRERLRLQQRAGYLLLHVHWRCPERLAPLLPALLALVEPGASPAHVSIPRQVFSVFQDREVPEPLAGRLFTAAVATFLRRASPTAARARALEAAANVAQQYPGLWGELSAVADGVAPDERPGVLSVSRRVVDEARRRLAAPK